MFPYFLFKIIMKCVVTLCAYSSYGVLKYDSFLSLKSTLVFHLG